MGNHPISSASDDARDRYWRAVAAEDKRLGDRIAEIRRQQDVGMFTVAEAADERIRAMEQHLAATKELRVRLLGGS
jgi:hypothetical protein